MVMIKKILLLIFGIFLVYYIYGEYQIQTKGIGVWIDRQKALGKVTNAYGIRDEDLALIESREYTKINKELFIQVAKDTQDIILNSNDKEWIKKNGRAIYIRDICLVLIELDYFKINERQNTLNYIYKKESERGILYQEFYYNFNDIGLTRSFPPENTNLYTHEDRKNYCKNLEIKEKYD